MGEDMMRELMFGRDQPCSTDPARLRRTLSESHDSLTALIDRLMTQLDGLNQPEGTLTHEISQMALDSLGQLRRGLGTDSSTRSASPTRPLRVVLMGRTMAGKSTLLEALTHGDGTRRGDGRQRFTRHVEERPLRITDQIRLVDTPGVGALDGPQDYETAFEQVPNADLVVWVAANDSTTEDTAVALRHISLLGKPVILVLNCRSAIPPGRRRQKFLREPERAFAMSSGHFRRISDIIHSVGGTTPPSLEVHAEAAYLAAAGSDQGPELHHASRIETLTETLLGEYHRNLEQRLALADADVVRTPLDQILAVLVELEVRAVEGRLIHAQLGESLSAKWTRSIDRHEDLGREHIRSLVAQRRNWADDIDVESDVEQAWQKESASLAEQINSELRDTGQRVSRALREISHALGREWARLHEPMDTLRPDTGRSSVWWNRVTKVGGRFGLVAGGSAIGLAVAGPPGAVVGGFAGLLAPLWDKVADRFFRSRAEVIRRRRREITKKLGPILDKLERDSLNVLAANMRRMREGTSSVLDSRQAEEKAANHMIEEIHSTAASVRDLLASVDTATASMLAALVGRSRLVPAIKFAYRLPGRAILAGVDESALCEQTLFPVSGTVERLVPIPIGGPPHRQAVYALLGLLDSPCTLTRITPNTVRALPDDPVPEGVRTTISALISFATQTDTTIGGE